MAAEPLSGAGNKRVVRNDDVVKDFGIQIGRELGGIDEVAKHHGQLTAFGVYCGKAVTQPINTLAEFRSALAAELHARRNRILASRANHLSGAAACGTILACG